MHVIIFDWSGEVIRRVNCFGQLQFPNNIAVNDDEQFLVCDNRADCVKVFTYSGDLVDIIGCTGLTNFPIGVAVGQNGDVIVADNHKAFNITVFDKVIVSCFGPKQCYSFQGGEVKHCFKSMARHQQCFDVAVLSDHRLIVCSEDCRLYVYSYEEPVDTSDRNSTIDDIDQQDTVCLDATISEQYDPVTLNSRFNFAQDIIPTSPTDLWKPLESKLDASDSLFSPIEKVC